MEALSDASRSSTQKFDYEGYSADIEKDIILRGDRVLDANVGFDPDSGLPQVNIRLDGDGGELMHRSTRHSVGRRMAVIFIETKTRDRKVIEDGIEVLKPEPYVVRRVVSLATVQSALGVNFRITGLQAGEARELSLLLRAGALAADMFIAEERTVGASLGAQNIKLGAFSVSVGLGLGGAVHAGLLQIFRAGGESCTDCQPGIAGSSDVQFVRNANAAGYCRDCSDCRYGGRCKRIDLFQDQGRA